MAREPANEGRRTPISAPRLGPLTVALALAEAKALGADRLDAQLLLAHALARTRSWLLAHDDEALGVDQAAAFDTNLRRRSAGEPLAYLVGEKEFHGLMLTVNPAVLIPRPETEMLVDWGLELLGGALAEVAAPQVLDLGTGSGAIAVAVKCSMARAAVCAVDVSLEALDVAKTNALRQDAVIEFRPGHWWAGMAQRRFHLVLSNPPYIEHGDPHLAALRHEPGLALIAGDRGLAALRDIVSGAPEHLESGGWLLLEHGHDQADAVQALLRGAGFSNPQTRHDLAGLPRCTGGHWQGHPAELA